MDSPREKACRVMAMAWIGAHPAMCLGCPRVDYSGGFKDRPVSAVPRNQDFFSFFQWRLDSIFCRFWLRIIGFIGFGVEHSAEFYIKFDHPWILRILRFFSSGTCHRSNEIQRSASAKIRIKIMPTKSLGLASWPMGVCNGKTQSTHKNVRGP